MELELYCSTQQRDFYKKRGGCPGLTLVYVRVHVCTGDDSSEAGDVSEWAQGEHSH